MIAKITDRNIRIVHITTSDRGGAGLCCLRIHQALLNMGMDSRVVTLINRRHAHGVYSYGFVKDKLSKIPSKVIRILGLTVTERNKIIRLSLQKKAAFSRSCSVVNLLDCEWVRRADVIHLHWVNGYLDFPSFLNGIDKPVVWTLHDENFFYGIAHYSDTLFPCHPLERKYAKIKRDAISGATKLGIVLLSEYFRRKFEGNELLQGREVRVINNPIDTEKFRPVDRKKARARLGLQGTDVLIGFTASEIFDNRKGLRVLSQAVEAMGNPRIKILAIGGNSDNLELPNMISVGTINDTGALSEALSAADFFAMPSFQEAFAQSPMEAMACGLPVVAFPVSGTEELVNERNGVVCDDFTAEALRHGIETLMSRRYDSAEIRQDMVKRFPPTAIAQKYIDFYNDMCHEGDVLS